MCVIYACPTAFPPDSELDVGAQSNGDGAGIAWMEDGKIRWMKGLRSDVDEVKKVIQEHNIKPPAAIHFRVASVGGKDPSLTHPFPVTHDVDLAFGGTEDCVLFHNGHINNWDDYVFRAGLASQVEYPLGPWSDSRGLAWLVALKGEGVLRFVLGQSRVLLFFTNPEATNPWDHFSVWGSWADPKDKDQGWLSSAEQYASRAVVRQLGPVRLKSDEETVKCEVIAAQSKATEIVGPANLNIWTVDELATLLSQIEEELRDARTAAGLEG